MGRSVENPRLIKDDNMVRLDDSRGFPLPSWNVLLHHRLPLPFRESDDGGHQPWALNTNLPVPLLGGVPDCCCGTDDGIVGEQTCLALDGI